MSSTTSPFVFLPLTEEGISNRPAALQAALHNPNTLALYEELREQYYRVAAIVSKGSVTGLHLSWQEIKEVRERWKLSREIRQRVKKTLKCRVCTGDLTKEEKRALWDDLLLAKRCLGVWYWYSKCLGGLEVRMLLGGLMKTLEK